MLGEFVCCNGVLDRRRSMQVIFSEFATLQTLEPGAASLNSTPNDLQEADGIAGVARTVKERRRVEEVSLDGVVDNDKRLQRRLHARAACWRERSRGLAESEAKVPVCKMAITPISGEIGESHGTADGMLEFFSKRTFGD